MSENDTITITWRRPDTPKPVAFQLPERIGTVKLTREIGRGGMGVVFLGEDELLHRRVAVKFLLTAGTEDDPGFKRFIEGARAAASVRHSGLTTVFQTDVTESVPFLIMEFVDGPSLSDLLQRHGALSPNTALSMIADISDAVAALHDEDIIHRDIKPANVLLNDSGQTFVTDFGLTCPRRNDSGGDIAGTPKYMAAEAFEGTVTERSDVYALGIMTYELLTGAPPFTGNHRELQAQHENTPLPREPLEAKNIAPEIINLIERATHKKPIYRFKSAANLARAIRNCEACPTGSQHAAFAALLHTTQSKAGAKSRTQENTPTSGSSGTYQSRIAEMANTRRQQKMGPDNTNKTTPPPAVNVPTDVLAVDVSCIQCGYNLRGLPINGRCPECGNETIASLQPDRLIFADKKWLFRVSDGFSWMYWSIIGFIFFGMVFGILFGLLMASTSNSLTDNATSDDPSTMMIIIGASTKYAVLGLAILAGGIFFIGLIRSIWPEPNQIGSKTSRTQSAARGAIFLAIAAYCMKRFIFTETWDILPDGLNEASYAVFFASFAIYTAKLVKRIPNHAMHRDLRIIAISMIALIGLTWTRAFLASIGLVDTWIYNTIKYLTLFVTLVAALGQLFLIFQIGKAAEVLFTAATQSIPERRRPPSLTKYWKSTEKS